MSVFTIRHLLSPTEKEMSSVVSCLVEAYSNDKGLLACVGWDRCLIPAIYRAMVLLGDEVYVAEVPQVVNGVTPQGTLKIVGVAIWFQPERESILTRPECYGQIQSLMTLLPRGVAEWWTEQFFPRWQDLSTTSYGSVEAHYNQWHLQALGVSSNYRRLGIAKSLIEPILRKKGNRKICTEAEKTENMSIYGRLGFKYVAEKRFSSEYGAFTMCSMVKE